MEEATQMVDLPMNEDDSSPIGALPVGYLKVFAQKAIEEKIYPVTEGLYDWIFLVTPTTAIALYSIILDHWHIISING